MLLGLPALIWLLTVGYALLYSGDQRVHHCKVSTVGALTGALPLCGAGTTALDRALEPGSAGFVGRMLDYAKAQIGKPYVWGGPTNGSVAHPNNFDCSGLTRMACLFASSGKVNLPHNAAAQMARLAKYSVPVGNRAAWQPGDLVFYFVASDLPQNPGHVAIYTGNGQIIEAPRPGENVQTAPLNLGPGTRIVGVRRPADTPGATGGGTKASARSAVKSAA